MGERQGLRFLWRTAPRAPRELFDGLPSLHPAVVQVLFNRGISTVEGCTEFVAGICHDPDDPLLLKDLEPAIQRLVKARERGEGVAIFTDYDADGVNAAAVLATGFRLMGIEPRVRLPNRFRDGYGLTEAAVAELAGQGARVIVTADCGSSSHDAAELARKLGVDLIVTDHHQCPPELPRAYALVNPWRPGCRYPCDHLCGAGVAYKLVQALADALHPDGRAAVEPLLDLVAVATIADIMPLQGENRRLVLAGLEIMNAFPRPGVRALIEVAGLQPGEVDAAALGFRLAPRVNAAGRLDDPSIAFRLLMAETYEEAHALAAEVNRLNAERQQLTRQLEETAVAEVRAQVEAGALGIVCGGERWPQGVVGLVAGKLAQTFNRPTLVYTSQDGAAVGSGRSIPGFDLLGALRACGDLFTRYGGHQAAAGFSMPTANAADLRERFDAAVRAVVRPEDLRPILSLDGYLRPDTVSLGFAAALDRLAPFGAGFQAPTFAIRGLRVAESRAVGADGQHWKVRLLAGNGAPPLHGIYFGQGGLADHFGYGATLDAAFALKRSQFNGRWRVDLELRDVAPLGSASPAISMAGERQRS